MRSIPSLALAFAACTAGALARPSRTLPALRAATPARSAEAAHALGTVPASTPTSTTAPDTSASHRVHGAPRGGASGGASDGASSMAIHRDVDDDTSIVRGLYVNRWAAQSERKMRRLIALADSTEINAFVIDMKDEFGLNYESSDPIVARNAGHGGHIPHLAALLDTLRAHHIRPIARIVVFKDSVAARVNPDHVIRKPDGAPWRDKKGLTWVDPYDHTIWEYDIRVAEEMARAGFREIQFDYIRFPEPYKSLPPQVFRDANGVRKPDALASFFRTACPRLHKLGARCTADIFGLVTTVHGALEVGQEWEPLAPVTDVLLPMVYPSHYPLGSFGVARPNADPYRIVHAAIARAHERDLALGITNPGHVRPWLQAFTLGEPRYGAHELEEQKRAVYDAGYDGWTLWNPGSSYDAVKGALERETVSRRKAVAGLSSRGSGATARGH